MCMNDLKTVSIFEGFKGRMRIPQHKCYSIWSFSKSVKHVSTLDERSTQRVSMFQIEYVTVLDRYKNTDEQFFLSRVNAFN
mmetsp:Transcript_8892/g.21750  ORF Transcript_8892/g.21750 Transcript_8892/m.21750 type:complete len:81 (-) Transcript_8892:2486-2728(-)